MTLQVTYRTVVSITSTNNSMIAKDMKDALNGYLGDNPDKRIGDPSVFPTNWNSLEVSFHKGRDEAVCRNAIADIMVKLQMPCILTSHYETEVYSNE